MPATPKTAKSHGTTPYQKAFQSSPSPSVSASPAPGISSAREHPQIDPKSDQKPPIPSAKMKVKKETTDSPKSAKGVRSKPAGSGRAWTPDEKRQLLHFALERNGRGWEMAVPGRTASQASQTWKVTVLPFLERALG